MLTFPRGPDPRNGKLPRVVTHQRRQCRCLSGQDWSDRPYLTLRAHLLAAWNWGEQLLATGWFKSYPRVSRTGGGVLLSQRTCKPVRRVSSWELSPPGRVVGNIEIKHGVKFMCSLVTQFFILVLIFKTISYRVLTN